MGRDFGYKYGYRHLELTLKKKWFDMIASGEKKEEYREIKPHWIRRFNPTKNLLDPCREFHTVLFRNGYSKNSPTIQIVCLEVSIGFGKPEWGAEPDKEYYIIKLGEVIPTDERSVANPSNSSNADH